MSTSRIELRFFIVLCLIVAVIFGAMAARSFTTDPHQQVWMIEVPEAQESQLTIPRGIVSVQRGYSISRPINQTFAIEPGMSQAHMVVVYALRGPEREAEAGRAAKEGELAEAVNDAVSKIGGRIHDYQSVSTSSTGMQGFFALLALFIAGLLFRRERYVNRLVASGALPADGSAAAAQQMSAASAVVVVEEGQQVQLADIAGMEEAKRELTEIIDFLRDASAFQRVGAKVPRGVLLYGPPGNGKTMLARAIASEAKVPLLTRAGSEFVEMFVGVGAKRVRELFHEARELARKQGGAVVFIDEIDVLGRKRSDRSGIENDQTLNQLLTEMDGMHRNLGIVVVGATNRLDMMDAAALRPGRFTRHIYVPMPDVRGRRAILDVHRKPRPFVEGIDWEGLARRTARFSGAMLENLLNEAAMLAGRRKDEVITKEDLDEAYLKTLAGVAAKRQLKPEAARRVAAHEAGHAIVQRAVRGPGSVENVSIIARGQALGITVVPDDNEDLPTERELYTDLATAMGGRVAEDLYFKAERSPGAANDLQRAHDIARRMVTEWGMGPRTRDLVGVAIYPRDEYGMRRYSEVAERDIDEAARKIVEHAYRLAAGIIDAHRAAVDAIIARLLEVENLSAEDFERIVAEAGGTQPVPDLLPTWE